MHLLCFFGRPIFVSYTVLVFFCKFLTCQTDITVQFTPVDGCTNYELSWKEHPAPWESASSTRVVATAGKTKVSAEGLEPGTTYCVRLTAIDPASGDKGEPGKELVLDTEQVGCTPTDSRSCCTIL